MVDGGKELYIQLAPQRLRGLHRVRQHRHDQQDDCHGTGAAQKGPLQKRPPVHGVGGRRGDRGAVQHFQDHVLKYVLRHGIVVIQQQLQRAEGILRGIRRHLQHQDVRLRQHGSRQCARQALLPQLAGGDAAEHVALKKLREGIGDLRGDRQVGKHG